MKEFGIGTITEGVMTPEQYAKTFKTLRDEFAMAVAGPIAGVLLEKVRQSLDCGTSPEMLKDLMNREYGPTVAEASYKIADACMKEREKMP